MGTFILYDKARELNSLLSTFLEADKLSYDIENQLSRASASILLNIAEGNGRFSKKDKRKFFAISRGSAHEVRAILDLLLDQKKLDPTLYSTLSNLLVEIIKISTTIINKT